MHCFKYLGKTNFKRLIELCDTCQNIVNVLDKNDEKWYQEFETINLFALFFHKYDVQYYQQRIQR